MKPPEKKTELSFRPITEGLGFHPFSDGLPYAPVAKTNPPTAKPLPPTPMGLGAISAGAPSFAKPTAHRVSVPVALRPQPAPVKPATATAPAAVVPDFEPTFFYLPKRALAWIFDTAINSGLCISALMMAGSWQGLPLDILARSDLFILSAMFVAVFSWAVIAAQEVAFGTSVGKRMFRLALRGNSSAIFLRAFFFIPSIGFCGLGLLGGLFNRRRRCWHDAAVDLQPIEIARL